MRVLQLEGPSFPVGEGTSFNKVPLDSASAFMSGDVASSEPERRPGLAAHEDARALVRLVQCPQCSRPFRMPVTLPCGHSLCRQCLPRPHLRENISYPDTPDRQQGLLCPVLDCGSEHPVGECSVDVTLVNVMECIANEVTKHRAVTEGTPMLLEEIAQWDESSMVEKEEEKNKSRILHGGRLVATYTLAEMGELDYRAEVNYRSLSETGDDYRRLDEALLDSLRETTHKELDCHVCYNTMYDPVTTPCGHTFCRRCLVRVLDHSLHCPMCRRPLSIPPSLAGQSSNIRLVAILLGLCPDLVAARAEAVALEERGTIGEMDVPLFICTLGFPSMPTFLHIFEPRYRLMIRRALEGNGQFGMLMYNRSGAPQGDLGATQFMEYGTMLQILNVQMLADGRSLIECRGVSRFKVRSYGVLDGYIVGSVERVEDISLAEEERIEADETSAFILPPDSPMQDSNAHSRNNNNEAAMPLERLSTRQLLLLGVDFVVKMRAHSAPWLHQRIIDAYGGPPDDPALFPYWFATILPIADEEKYLLMRTTSVRERLKIVAQWIRRIERQRWYTGSACTVL